MGEIRVLGWGGDFDLQHYCDASAMTGRDAGESRTGAVCPCDPNTGHVCLRHMLVSSEAFGVEAEDQRRMRDRIQHTAHRTGIAAHAGAHEGQEARGGQAVPARNRAGDEGQGLRGIWFQRPAQGDAEVPARALL